MFQMKYVIENSVKTEYGLTQETIPGEGAKSDDDRNREEKNAEDDTETDLAAAEYQAVG